MYSGNKNGCKEPATAVQTAMRTNYTGKWCTVTDTCTAEDLVPSTSGVVNKDDYWVLRWSRHGMTTMIWSINMSWGVLILLEVLPCWLRKRPSSLMKAVSIQWHHCLKALPYYCFFNSWKLSSHRILTLLNQHYSVIFRFLYSEVLPSTSLSLQRGYGGGGVWEQQRKQLQVNEGVQTNSSVVYLRWPSRCMFPWDSSLLETALCSR